MSTLKTTSITINTDDLRGNGTATYNIATNQRVGVIKISFNGGVISFASVLDYQTFLSQVVIPLTNSLNSTTGTGVGYVAATIGTPGSDKVID